VIRKAIKRGSGRGGWKRTEYFSTSLAAYSTSRTVLRGLGASNGPWLPDPHERRCIEDLNAIGESLVELPEPKPKKKKKL